MLTGPPRFAGGFRRGRLKDVVWFPLGGKDAVRLAFGGISFCVYMYNDPMSSLWQRRQPREGRAIHLLPRRTVDEMVATTILAHSEFEKGAIPGNKFVLTCFVFFGNLLKDDAVPVGSTSRQYQYFVQYRYRVRQGPRLIRRQPTYYTTACQNQTL